MSIQNVLRWLLQQVSRRIFASFRFLRALIVFLKRRRRRARCQGPNEGPSESSNPTQQLKTTNKPRYSIVRPAQDPSSSSYHQVGPTSSAATGQTSVPSARAVTPAVTSSASSSSLHTGGYSATIPSFTTAPGAPLTSLFAVVPDFIKRKELRVAVQRSSNKTVIAPGKLYYSETAPDGWQHIIHPEGARYFYNARMRVFTDTDMNDAKNTAEIEAYMDVLRREERRIVPDLDKETQLVIQLWEEDTKRIWCYYFVHHDTRTLFWVTPFHAQGLFGNLEGVMADSHIGYAIEEQYWIHCERYPSCMSLATELINEVWGTIAQADADCITSDSPLSPLSEVELGKILGLIPYLQVRAGEMDDYAIWIVSRVMYLFARPRFYNFHGQPGARLDADQSVYSKHSSEETSLIFVLLDLLFFRAPSAHVRKLSAIWVDQTINYPRWQRFKDTLATEWAGFTIYSTVMLAVDVSFLAIPGVDQGVVDSQSVATIAIYMSFMTTVGSLVSSVLLAQQSQLQEDSAVGAASFMKRITCFGVGTPGVMFSLPFALLIWAIIFFVTGLMYVILDTTDRVTLATMIPGALIIVILTLLPVWWGRDYGAWWTAVKAMLLKSGMKPQSQTNKTTEGLRTACQDRLT